jgi:hypothetical protein
MRAAIYARVSTIDQEPENQLAELRQYAEARAWTAREYVDRGVSGAKDKRPALDDLVRDAKRRRFDVVVCWRLDRLGRNLKHLITLLDELQAVGVAFVSLAEGIDATTPAASCRCTSSARSRSSSARALWNGSGPGSRGAWRKGNGSAGRDRPSARTIWDGQLSCPPAEQRPSWASLMRPYTEPDSCLRNLLKTTSKLSRIHRPEGTGSGCHGCRCDRDSQTS